MNEENSLGLYFNIMSKEIKKVIDKKLNNNLTNIQMCILCFLDKNNDKELYQKDIEKFLFIRRSTTTEILSIMERNNLIEREELNSDKRKKIIKLSKLGKKYVTEFKDVIREIERELFNNITKEEYETFFIILEKIKENIYKLQEEIC